jgi:hypothetical protein
VFEAFEVLVETTPQDGRSRRSCDRFRHHDEVQRRQILCRAERFARKPLEAIAIDRSLGGSSRDRKPESCVIAIVRSRKHGEKGIRGARCVSEHAAELGSFVQALMRREPCSGARQRNAKPVELVRGSAERALFGGGSRALCALPSLPFSNGSRGFSCDADCSVDRFSSWLR